MTIRVTAFARIREIVGAAESERSLPEGATADDLYAALAAEFPDLAALRASTRFANGGALVAGSAVLHHGDEIALLPPFGGG